MQEERRRRSTFLLIQSDVQYFCVLFYTALTTLDLIMSKMINIQIYVVLEGESVFKLESKLSPNSSVKAAKDILKICGKSEADVCVYKDKLN